jgi:hypothetical protein
VGFEPTIAAKTVHALVRAATVIGIKLLLLLLLLLLQSSVAVLAGIITILLTD